MFVAQSLVGSVLVLIVFNGHSTGGQQVQSTEYAMLAVPRYNMTILLDTEHRRGDSVLQGEFRVKRHLSKDEVNHYLGTDHVRFCHHADMCLLESTTATTGSLTRQPTFTSSPEAMIG